MCLSINMFYIEDVLLLAHSSVVCCFIEVFSPQAILTLPSLKFICITYFCFLAHLSQRFIGELII